MMNIIVRLELISSSEYIFFPIRYIVDCLVPSNERFTSIMGITSMEEYTPLPSGPSTLEIMMPITKPENIVMILLSSTVLISFEKSFLLTVQHKC
jgi:hypothetical protein